MYQVGIWQRSFRALAYVFFLTVALSGCALVNGDSAQGPSDTLGEPEGTTSVIPYDVLFSGLPEGEAALEGKLREVSNAIRLKDRPTSTLAGLRRRAEDDVERFASVLRSVGFYDARVDFALDGGVDRAVVTYQLDTGAEYLLSEVTLRLVHPDETIERDLSDEELQRVGLSIGMPVAADPVLLAEQQVVEIIRDQGYPLARAGGRKAVANTELKSLHVTYEVVSGQKARFGKVTVSGAVEVAPDFIASYASWADGAQFSPKDQKETRTRLARSNLFESVTVQTGKEISADGEIPMEIHVIERKHRTIGGGVDYSTADGLGANAFWEHRNILGRGERLRLRVQGSALEQGVEGNFRKPQFLRDQQALVAEAQAKTFDTDAYDGELADAYLGIDRQLSDIWSVAFGVTAEYSDLTGIDSPNEQFYLGGLRGVLRRDSTDSPLDPTEGSRLELSLSPYTSLTGESARFTSMSLTASKYYAFDEDARWVLAGRGRVGSIVGEDLSDLPANKRFYSGGGGSVRGYEYQLVGPLDGNDDPTGGRSVIDGGLELRVRLSDSFGLVPFVEGGNVFENSSPEDFDFFWAAGLGLRYYTGIGPLRFDVAVPLDKREDVDDDFQIYVSIGQAF